MRKKNFSLEASIINLGKVESFFRKGKTPLYKQSLGLKTKDGQKLFCELREDNFETVKYMSVGTSVKIEYVFAGSIKDSKRYNNIIVTKIETL